MTAMRRSLLPLVGKNLSYRQAAGEHAARRYNAIWPDDSATWQIRFQIQLMSPSRHTSVSFSHRRGEPDGLDA